MKKNKKLNAAVKFSVIDVDEQTAEPKLVELSREEYELRVAESGDAHSAPFTVSDENAESVGKQIVMNKVFGIDEKESVSKRQKIFKRITTILFFVLVGGVLCWTAYNDFFSGKKELPSPEYLYSIFSTRWFYLLFAFFSLACCYFFKALKHSLLAKKLKGKWRFGLCLDTAVIGLYYNYVTPLAVGGQPFEIYNLTKNGFSVG